MFHHQGAADGGGGGVHSNDLHEKRFLSKNRRKCRVREFFGKLQNTDLLTTYVAWKASHSWGLHVISNVHIASMRASPV